MYKQKYIKYKIKYINSKMNQRGGGKNIILLDGTSTAGKSTISKYLVEKNGYVHICNDDYGPIAYKKFISELSNEYISEEKMKKLVRDAIYDYMISESKKHDKVVFDDVAQDILDYIDRNKIYIVVVYTSIDNLVRNIANRNKKGESIRYKRHLHQFTKRYIRSESEKGSIDKINRKSFIENLKKYLKYEFASENELIEFANNIFAEMNITDDNDHYIKLRNEYQYDYILKTSSKNPEELYNELKSIIL